MNIGKISKTNILAARKLSFRKFTLFLLAKAKPLEARESPEPIVTMERDCTKLENFQNKYITNTDDVEC